MVKLTIYIFCDYGSYYGKIPMNWVQTTLNYIGIVVLCAARHLKIAWKLRWRNTFYKPADLLQGELYNATEYLSVLGNTKSRKIKARFYFNKWYWKYWNCWIVRVDGAFNQQMHGIEVFNFVNSKFLLFLTIQSDFMQKQFKNNTSSTTIPILNKTRFSQTMINFSRYTYTKINNY